MLQSSYKKHESISTTSPCWRSQRGPIPWLLLEPNLFQACLLFFKMVHDASGKGNFLSQLTKYCKFYLVKPRWAVAWGCRAPAMMCGRAMRRARNGARTIPSPIQSSLSPVLPFYIARCLWQPSLCSAAIVNVTRTQIKQCFLHVMHWLKWQFWWCMLLFYTHYLKVQTRNNSKVTIIFWEGVWSNHILAMPRFWESHLLHPVSNPRNELDMYLLYYSSSSWVWKTPPLPFVFGKKKENSQVLFFS